MQQKNGSGLSVDDDEHPSEQSAYGSPWEEIRARYEKVGKGSAMSSKDEWWLKEHMELSGIAPERLLELVDENPLHGFVNPMAGLKWLVKNFRTKSQSAVELESAAEPVRRFMAPVEGPRCERCDGTGRVLERTGGERPRLTDQYCDCPMGKDLRSVEGRKPTAMARPSEGRVEPSQVPWRPVLAGSGTGDNHAVN
jgi:hypothetical protein